MTKKAFFYPLLWLALLLLTGCVNLDSYFVDEHADQDMVPSKQAIHAQVRFLASDGRNILGWMDDIVGGGYNHFVSVDDQWLNIRCIRGSDGAEMTFSVKSILVLFEGETDEFCDGPVLCLNWFDFDWYKGQNVTFPLHETYTIHIRSTRFWLGEERTIEWGIDVLSNFEYKVTSCTIDGVSSSAYLDEAFTDGVFRGRVTLRARPNSQYPHIWDYPVIPHDNN